MAKGKKFYYQAVQTKTGWRADIVRQVTSRKTRVSKSQDGFSTEAEAQVWGEKELESFAKNLSERNKQRSEKRELEAKQLEEKKHKDELMKASKLAEREAESAVVASVWNRPEGSSDHD